MLDAGWMLQLWLLLIYRDLITPGTLFLTFDTSYAAQCSVLLAFATFYALSLDSNLLFLFIFFLLTVVFIYIHHGGILDHLD